MNIPRVRQFPAYVLAVAILLAFAALACAGTPLFDTPIYTCPTRVPPTVQPGMPAPIPPTPYVITPPQAFYVGDPIFVGSQGVAHRVRFRLQNVRSYAALPIAGQSRRIYAWQLEVRNLGTQNYEIYPSVQMYLSTVLNATGETNGVWGSPQAAAAEAGLTIDNQFYTLIPNETRTFRFAAYAPVGSARYFTFTLDPTVTTGSPTMRWVNQSNPYC